MTATIEETMQKCHSIVVTGKILCCGEDSVIDNFTQTIRVRGDKSGAKIKGIKEILLPFNIDLPDDFSKRSNP
jgi:hypothetical protein